MTPKRKYPRPDPLIDEIRAIRKSLHDQVGGDIAKLAELANEAGKKFREKVRSRRRSTSKR
jgi:hypothetical protein